MTKELFVQQELERGRRRAARAETIQQLYLSYLDDPQPDTINRMLSVLEAFARGTVYEVLKTSAHYTESDIADALQEGLIAVSLAVERHRQEGVRMDGFCWFARTVCRNQAAQYVRDQYRLRGKKPPIPLLWQDEDGNELEFLGQQEDPVQLQEDLERQQLNRRLLLMYCDALLGYRYDPQKALGVCYARLLYQLVALLEEDRQTHTASSIPWAWEQMGEKDLLRLGMASQKCLQEHLHPALRWHKPFLEKLRSESPYGQPWKDVVYTHRFTQSQTSNWVESIHKSVFQQVRRRIHADPALLEAVRSIRTPMQDGILERR